LYIRRDAYAKKWFAGVYAKQGYCFSTLKKNHRGLYKRGREFFENTENGSTFNSGRKGMEEMSCGKYGQRCS
jgi:hypothetical protein